MVKTKRIEKAFKYKCLSCRMQSGRFCSPVYVQPFAEVFWGWSFWPCKTNVLPCALSELLFRAFYEIIGDHVVGIS